MAGGSAGLRTGEEASEEAADIWGEDTADTEGEEAGTDREGNAPLMEWREEEGTGMRLDAGGASDCLSVNVKVKKSKEIQRKKRCNNGSRRFKGLTI